MSFSFCVELMFVTNHTAYTNVAFMFIITMICWHDYQFHFMTHKIQPLLYCYKHINVLYCFIFNSQFEISLALDVRVEPSFTYTSVLTAATKS